MWEHPRVGCDAAICLPGGQELVKPAQREEVWKGTGLPALSRLLLTSFLPEASLQSLSGTPQDTPPLYLA